MPSPLAIPIQSPSATGPASVWLARTARVTSPDATAADASRIAVVFVGASASGS